MAARAKVRGRSVDGSGDSIMMLSEASETYPARPCVHFVYVQDVDSTYRAAMRAEAKSIPEPTDQPSGDRLAGFIHSFDNRWWVVATRGESGQR